MLDFSLYFDQIFECRLTNSPDVGLEGMPNFPLPMHLNVPMSLSSQSPGPNLFKEIVVANRGAITPQNPPEFDIFVPGAACPVEVTCCLQQCTPRTDQMGDFRPTAMPLLLKVYQQTAMGGDNFSADIVCKSNWIPARDSMVSFCARAGGRFLVTCGFPSVHNPICWTLVFRVYSSCDGVVVAAKTARKAHNAVEAGSENEARAIKWTLVGCRAAHRSDETQPEPYKPSADGILQDVDENDFNQPRCKVM
jgi:hypothetical protein